MSLVFHYFTITFHRNSNIKDFDKRKIRSSVTSEYNDQVNRKFRKEKLFSFLYACECCIIGVIFGLRSLDCRILSLGVAYHLVEYGITDAVTLCAAVLHDTVEDTDATFKEIEEHFGAEVEWIVREVKCEVAWGTSSIYMMRIGPMSNSLCLTSRASFLLNLLLNSLLPCVSH